MVAPNIQSPTSVTLKGLVSSLGTSSTTLVSNNAASNKAIKLSSVVVANKNTANNVSVSVQVVVGTGSTNAYSICQQVTVPAKASLFVVSRDNPIYLTEDMEITASASAGGSLDATGSYEEIA